MNIILIGFMGSGKSSVAQKLQQSLNLPLVEMDDLVLQKTQSKNMHEVFDKGGEFLLRETEISIAKEFVSNNTHIISTGAGIVLNKIIIDCFKKNNGVVYFLNTSFKTITNRLIEDTTRPLFKNPTEAESLYHFRQPLYKHYADKIIDADEKTIDVIAEEIVQNHLRNATYG